MRCLLLILLLLLSPSVCLSDILCGSTIYTSGSYTLDSNKTCDAEWVTISAADVTIDMQGYTVTYANVSTPMDGAVTLGGVIVNNNNFHISGGGAITQGVYGGSGIFSRSRYLSGVSITDTTINITDATYLGGAIMFRDMSSGTAVTATITGNTIYVVTPSGYMRGIYAEFPLNSNVDISGNTFTVSGQSGRAAAVYLAGGSGIDITSNTVTVSGVLTNGLTVYNSTANIKSNTLTMSGDNVKGIQVDGNSTGCFVDGNHITLSTTYTTGNSYGIRVRFAANNNVFSDNVCNSSAADRAFCFVVGGIDGEFPGQTPNNITVKTNTFYGVSPLVQVQGETDNATFCSNTVESTDNGVLVDLYGYSDEDNIINNIDFSGEDYTTGGASAVSVRTKNTASNFTNIVFCGVTFNNSTMVTSDMDDQRTAFATGVTVENDPCASCNSGSPLGGNSHMLNIGSGGSTINFN